MREFSACTRWHQVHDRLIELTRMSLAQEVIGPFANLSRDSGEPTGLRRAKSLEITRQTLPSIAATGWENAMLRMASLCILRSPEGP